MKTRSLRVVVVLSALVLVGFAFETIAQPTYKLSVKPDLKPLATLQLEGAKISRTDLKDDPGFRLQYHFKKDGKSLAQVEARTSDKLDVPQKEAGTYTVVLELFYPAYKGGTAQKGEFKTVSNVLTYKVEPAAKPDEPVKVTVIETPAPTPAPEKK
ncbi:MAG: hypothetical protein K2R98_21390 [Gemmataceae bacterium]|nr:hypothetical protein [Gemmataceae bacterium]